MFSVQKENLMKFFNIQNNTHYKEACNILLQSTGLVKEAGDISVEKFS